MNGAFVSGALILNMVLAAAALAQTPAAAPAGQQPAAPPATATAASAPASAAPSAGTEEGLAAVYTDKLAGHKTASGKTYDPDKLTAAHKTLPFGTRVKVTNNKNGRTVQLRITDRGPKQPDRVLDISRRAARALGIPHHGMAKVTVEVVN